MYIMILRFMKVYIIYMANCKNTWLLILRFTTGFVLSKVLFYASKEIYQDHNTFPLNKGFCLLRVWLR